MPSMFRDRRDAGRVLATALANVPRLHDAIVLALPRGGVPVAYEVAGALNLPLDVMVVRKLGAPWHPEQAIGALATGGVAHLDSRAIRDMRLDVAHLRNVIAAERAELERREARYRPGLPPLHLPGRTAILVDDGLATGATMKAAVDAARKAGCDRVIVAVPIGPRETVEELAHAADAVVCPCIPEQFEAVGEWYEDFSQLTDDEVCDLLSSAAAGRGDSLPTPTGGHHGDPNDDPFSGAPD